MYEDLRQIFWWDGMKKDIAYFVACCDICNKVKAEHQKPVGLLQPLPIPQWKWDEWIPSPVYQEITEAMMQYGLWWTH